MLLSIRMFIYTINSGGILLAKFVNQTTRVLHAFYIQPAMHQQACVSHHHQVACGETHRVYPGRGIPFCLLEGDDNGE